MTGKLTQPVGTLVGTALDVVFPPLCRSCEEVLPDGADSLLCEACSSKMQPISSSCCPQCGAPVDSTRKEGQLVKGCPRCPSSATALSFVRSAVRYDSPVRELIHHFKFRGSEKVRPLLLEWFLKGAEEHLKRADYDAIVPVPLHWWRRFQREFNQAEILGRRLADEWSVPLLAGALRRKRSTLPQSRLRGKWRSRNIAGAFVAGKTPVCGMRLLIVDDVMTTGATLSACAEVLLKVGASSVVGYTLARRL